MQNVAIVQLTLDDHEVDLDIGVPQHFQVGPGIDRFPAFGHMGRRRRQLIGGAAIPGIGLVNERPEGSIADLTGAIGDDDAGAQGIGRSFQLYGNIAGISPIDSVNIDAGGNQGIFFLPQVITLQTQPGQAQREQHEKQQQAADGQKQSGTNGSLHLSPSKR